jgi:hypothetical protein
MAQGARQDAAGGSTDHEHLRNAEQNIGSVNGDVIAGAKIVNLLGGSELRLEALSPEDANEARYAYVNPEGWDDLRLSFHSNRITLLRGEPGHGRRATAIRLTQTTTCERVYELDRQQGLDRLGQWLADDSGASQRIETGSAFIVDDPVGIATMRGYELRRFAEALSRHDSRLVLTLAADEAPSDGDLSRYLLDLAPPPPRRKILYSHLRYHLGSEARADALLERPDVDALVSELLIADCSCAQAARLAQIIAQEPDEGLDVIRIRQRWGQQQDRVAIWFDGLGDVATRAFAIALAVLNGLAYDDIAYAARILTPLLEPRILSPLQDRDQRLLSDERGQFSVTPVFQPFQLDRDRLLRTLRAVTAEEDTLEPYGRVPVTVMRYADPQYSRRVIQLAWTSYQIQHILLEWLRDLVASGARQVRVYAGTALGALASLSFDHVFRRALQDWATNSDPNVRTAVAYAMRQAIKEPRLRPLVDSLVAGWYVNRAIPAAQATAARVHGIGLGSDLSRALAALERLATVKDADYTVPFAVGASLADLILVHEERAALEVLQAIVRWLDDHRRAETAELAFLLVTSTLMTEVRDEDTASHWPTLLHLAQKHEPLREPLVRLWRMMLDRAFLSHDARLVLGSWAALAEADEQPRGAFVRLVRVMANDPRTRQVLCREAALWVDEDNLQTLPLTEAAVSDAIGRWEEIG